jgi:hypothetical protein
MTVVLLTTTINIPTVLTQYARDLAEHGPSGARIIVVGDQKTPSGASDFCTSLAQETGVPTQYLGVKEQCDFLTPFRRYASFLPWNCIQRRNVAILMAYVEGAEVVYTIDDDNYLHEPRYVGSHGNLGKHQPLTLVSSSSGWYNICSHLQESRSRAFFHRGFSSAARTLPDPKVTVEKGTGRIVVNAGLWLGDPDVDAVTRLAIAPDVVGCDLTDHLVLARGTVSPFNSQNTGVYRDVIPAYCMHVGVGRYDDIVAAYFVKRIADHLGDYISFGRPLVRQLRNEHDLWRDVDAERVGFSIVDDLVRCLYDTALTGTDYGTCVGELVQSLERHARDKFQHSGQNQAFIRAIRDNYEAWTDAISISR